MMARAKLSGSVTKTLRDACESFLDGIGRQGDVSVAGFILQHCFGAGIHSIASIGMASDAEFLMLNSLVDPGANFVLLNTDLRGRYRQRFSELTHRLEHEGFDARVLIADLTLPGRWPELISALAAGDVRILGLDAGWARTDPDFWGNLSGFLRSTERVVYVRGALDYEHPDTSIEFLRTMPDDHDLEVVVATRASVWFAPRGPLASAIRKALRLSGLFASDGHAATEESDDSPVIVRTDSAAGMLDAHGRFPLVIYRIGVETMSSLEFGAGWSTFEQDGCWTEGSEAQLAITPPAGATALKRLHIVGNPWMPPDEAGQDIELGIGKKPKGWTQLHFDQGDITGASIDLQHDDLVKGQITLTVRVQRPGRPSDYGGADSRMLGFKLRSLGLFT
jgi:hypothetical protein